MTLDTKERIRPRSKKPATTGEASTGAWKPASKLNTKKGLALVLTFCLAIVGALFAYFGLSGQGGHKVLTYKGNITRGQAITPDMLSTMSVTDIPAGALGTDQASTVLNKIAATDIPAGSLVLPGTYASTLGVKNGSSIVGVAVQVSQMPVRSLQAGDKIRVVFTPTDAGAATSAEQSVAGVIQQVNLDGGAQSIGGGGQGKAAQVTNTGLVVVDVLVATGDAAKAARWSSAKAASIVLDGEK